MIDWHSFWVWLLAFGKVSLDASKTAESVVKTAGTLMPFIHRTKSDPPAEEDEEISPDWASERVRAGADILRSYVPFAFGELILYGMKLAFACFFVREWVKLLQRLK